MPIAAELDMSLALLIVVCELSLLVFLFCIGRFYMLKFGDRTYYAGFLIPVLVFGAAMIIWPLTGASLESVVLLANVSVLAVVLTLGIFLYLRMTGVSK